MDQKDTIYDILTQREDFLVIGLTGRMGSGCSKVAEILATPFDEMKFPHPIPQPGLRSLTEEERTIRIIAEYAQWHWLKFDVIRASAVIATFILDDDSRFINDLSSGVQEDKQGYHRTQFREQLLKTFCLQLVEVGFNCGVLDKNAERKYYIIADSAEKKEAEDAKMLDQYYEVRNGIFVRKLLNGDYRQSLQNVLEKQGQKLHELVGEDDNLKNYFDEESNVAFIRLLSSEADRSTESTNWEQIGNNMSYLYRQIPEENKKLHRRKYLECVDKLLMLLSYHCLLEMIDGFLQKGAEAATTAWSQLCDINKCVEQNAEGNNNVSQIQKFVFVKYLVTWLGMTIRKYITESLGPDAYARLFQRYGQMIRYESCILPYTGSDPADNVAGDKGKNMAGNENDNTNKPPKYDIFAIPRRINQHIKVLRHPFLINEHRPVRIVVDSIKNVFEAVYLRYRYSAFYLWAITTDSVIREQRLRDKHLTDTQVRKLDWNEYPDKGSEVIIAADKIVKENNLDLDEVTQRENVYKVLTEKLGKAETDFYLDSLISRPQVQSDQQASETYNNYYLENEIFSRTRREFFRNNTYSFYSQDIDSCVCNADVYLFNNAKGATDTENNRKLLEAVVRNISLVMYPCLVRPTPVERCMQIALSAKVNSGCLSRQVGAVVTDSQYNILAIGWNDVPCGEVPCAYKNLNDISKSADPDAYSEYELHNGDFRKRLDDYRILPEELRGLPMSYCFKNVHKDIKDPMRSRAMHAEEKALALCGREAEGGYLFTTSSPCEMCSKNAKNHRIQRIYYLEAYPGISQAQYTNSGDKNNRAELILFSGAVGRAYTQMYTPLLPHKDVLQYLGDGYEKRKNRSAEFDG